jgi:hypothetical protein
MRTLLVLFAGALALVSTRMAAASGFGEGSPLAIVAGPPLDAPDPRPALEARDVPSYHAPEAALFGMPSALFPDGEDADETNAPQGPHLLVDDPTLLESNVSAIGGMELSIDGHGGVYVEGERVALHDPINEFGRGLTHGEYWGTSAGIEIFF